MSRISFVLGRLESSRIGLASHKSARLRSESATASISSKLVLGQLNLVSEHLAVVLFIETQFPERFSAGLLVDRFRFVDFLFCGVPSADVAGRTPSLSYPGAISTLLARL